MIWQLPQHIYTSTGRKNFETVAVSPDISADVVRNLEARARSYPDRRLWDSTSSSPPFIMRGFRISGSEHIWGVSLLQYVGASLDRPEGNYLAHSYIIPAGLLREQDYNLAWIPVCLPIRHDYDPIGFSGADRLDPLPVDIDAAKQLLLFAFVARELTTPGIRGVIERLVEHACRPGGAPLDIEMPGPHKELVKLYEDVLGFAPETAPGPDVLRLLRLAGALAILPAAFKQNLSFSVNDTPSEQYSLRLLRAASAGTTSSDAGWPWLDHCVKLAFERDLDGLGRLHGWLTRLLSAEYEPSRKALDAGLDFYRNVISPASAKETDTEVLMNQLRTFQGCDVAVGLLHDETLPLLCANAPTYQESCEFYGILGNICAPFNRELPGNVLSETLKCLRVLPERSKEIRQRFFRNLPPKIQAQIWNHTYVESTPPGAFGNEAQSADPVHLRFALANFSFKVMKDEPSCAGIVKDMMSVLQWMGHAPPSRFPDGLPTDCLNAVRGMHALIGSPQCDWSLLAELAHKFAVVFIKGLQKIREPIVSDALSLQLNPGPSRQKVICWAVTSLLYDSTPLGPRGLAQFARELLLDNPHYLVDLLLALNLGERNLARSLEFIAVLDRVWPDCPFGGLLLALLELAQALSNPGILDGPMPQQLSRYGRWIEHGRRGQRKEWEIQGFWNILYESLEGSSPEKKIAVGASYVYYYRDEKAGVFERVLKGVETNPERVANWMAADGGFSHGRGKFLMMMLVAAQERHSSQTDWAFACANRVLRSLRTEKDLERVLTQLSDYLDRFSSIDKRQVLRFLRSVTR